MRVRKGRPPDECHAATLCPVVQAVPRRAVPATGQVCLPLVDKFSSPHVLAHEPWEQEAGQMAAKHNFPPLGPLEVSRAGYGHLLSHPTGRAIVYGPEGCILHKEPGNAEI